MEKRFHELCYACRVGDADNVDRLVSTGVNLNTVDQFDNSPLFLASLCGHEKVVKLLLNRGAVCDRDRYEGARCIYGALTDSIRDILLKHDISKAVDINQPFIMHISSLLKDSSLETHDACVGLSRSGTSNQRLRLHKFILSARSPKLSGQLPSLWNHKHNIDLPLEISMEVLRIIVKFIYLVPVLHEIDSKDYETLISVSRSWGMDVLVDFLEKARLVFDPSEKSTLMAEYQFKFTEIARSQLHSFVDENILKNTVDIDTTYSLAGKVALNMLNTPAYPDVLLLAESPNKKMRLFPCHLAILSRSTYFRLMFTLPLAESSIYKQAKCCKDEFLPQRVPVISFPCCKFEIVEIVLRYLYYDSAEIPWQFAVDLLLIADLLLEDRMKSMAAVVITQSNDILEHYSVFGILYVAWETRMERLEHYAAKVIACSIERYATDPELKKAIMLSSQRISFREETDSIELVDDIRYYLLEKYAFEADDIDVLSNEEDLELLKNSGILEYKQDIETIENILDELLLQA